MDGDDLDELLDEVERTFCRNVSVSSQTRTDQTKEGTRGKDNDGQRKNVVPEHEQQININTKDIDDLLEELLEEEDESNSPRSKTETPPKGRHAERTWSSQSGGRKCCPVFLGGSSVTNGVGTATTRRSCDRLRCTSCDFRVLMFDDSEWDSSCDYLFFRNNMPDYLKLRAKLRKRRGLRAYACQCSWYSSLEASDLREQPQLRWVCGNHPD